MQNTVYQVVNIICYFDFEKQQKFSKMNEVLLVTKSELKAIIREQVIEILPDFMQEPEKKYNLEEAANYLKMAIPTFRLHQHKIGGAKMGRRWIFTKTELDAFVQRNRKQPELQYGN